MQFGGRKSVLWGWLSIVGWGVWLILSVVACKPFSSTEASASHPAVDTAPAERTEGGIAASQIVTLSTQITLSIVLPAADVGVSASEIMATPSAPSLVSTPTVSGSSVTPAAQKVLPPPTMTPTSLPLMVATLVYPGPATGDVFPPPPVPPFTIPAEVVTVLLVGTDEVEEGGTVRTDSMIVVAIDTQRQTASMLSLPRDLYVYLPGTGMRNRLNSALYFGEVGGHPGGGIGELKETILYNFGIPIHYYAQIDMAGFQQMIDLLGGVDILVSCAIEDWRLQAADLDPEVEDNWELFELPAGEHHMNGDTALWYVRSRRSTSDFDRGRRQQQLLRALLYQGVEQQWLPRIPEIWQAASDMVMTDIDIGRMLQLAALAPTIEQNGVEHIFLAGDNVSPWVEPASGAWVLLPQWDAHMQTTISRLFTLPAIRQAARPPIRVEIINASGAPEFALLAADNLTQFGFVPVLGGEASPQRESRIHYYGPNFKGSFHWLVGWVFSQDQAQVDLVSDVDYEYDYQVVLGQTYEPCRPYMHLPQIYQE